MQKNDHISIMSISGFQKTPIKLQRIFLYNANQVSVYTSNELINIAL